ncbi:transcriptional regulator [Leptolyngbya sp. 'hensonii']|uniref:GntR family transcriptional regulator n=1 Tax=Leptolyngbya sp. 'hensonii' TaxID=1922337 RepID=UPI00094FAF92|nr:GntR family transcriptional regulator [Leptolyngbya sp. 'hensonii']OLP17883.1 transcriptional regulator [Leptolyngbya sp. 'hensonii']
MPLPVRSLQRVESLQKQAYQTLRTAILTGELAPGQRLVEAQLAEMLQVSRTPIREAIGLLQHENLAAVDPTGVLRVTTISAIDASHLYDCRLALEQLAVIEACRQVTPAQLQQLQQLVLEAETRPKGEATPLSDVELLDLDYQFHHLIAQSSGNPWLVSLLDQVFDKMMLLRSQTLKSNPAVLEIRLEHRRIYEMLAQRDGDGAAQSIREHLTASKERVIREVAQLQSSDERL